MSRFLLLFFFAIGLERLGSRDWTGTSFVKPARKSESSELLRPLVTHDELTPAELSVRETSALDPDPFHGRLLAYTNLSVRLILLDPVLRLSHKFSFCQIKLQSFSDCI